MKKASVVPSLKKGTLKNAHASNAKKGMGDFYGTGMKNPVVKSKEIMGKSTDMKKKTPPKSLA